MWYPQEREEAAKLFQTEDGKDNTLAQSIADTKTKTFEVGSALNQNGHGASGTRLTQEEQLKIKEALKQATSLDEISRLERLLKSGQIPKQFFLSFYFVFIHYYTHVYIHIFDLSHFSPLIKSTFSMLNDMFVYFYIVQDKTIDKQRQ